MLSDLKFAFRLLRKNKGLTAAVLLTLALCIGANVFIFSMLFALVLKPLPFPHAEQLVEISNSYPKLGLAKYRGNVTQYVDYARHPELFSGVALYLSSAQSIGDVTGPMRIDMARVTPSFFPLLGLQPELGRFFDEAYTDPGNDQYVVLADSFWRSHYGADPGVIGRTLTIEEIPHIIIGIAPPAANYFAPTTAFFVPQSWKASWLDDLSRHTKDPSLVARLFARLQPGLTLPQAAARTGAIDRAYYDRSSVAYRRYSDQSGFASVVHWLQDEQTEAQRGTLFLLQGGALFVLLIGCVNVANLLLARAASRQSELAIRHALGGSRAQIARQLMLEALLLALGGGALGAGLGAAGIGFMNRFSTAVLRAAGHITLNAPMLAFALGLSLVVGLVVGLIPIGCTLRQNLLVGIQQSSRNASLGRRSRLFGSLLASGQIALSLMLLVGTGLLVRSLIQAMAVPAGFDAHRVTTVRVAIPSRWFNDFPNVTRTQDRIIASLSQIPGVEAVGLSTVTPMTSAIPIATLFIQGAGGDAESARPLSYFFSVSPGFFPAMGVPILSGRPFDARDNDPNTGETVIIDRRLAERYFAGESPIGRHIAANRPPVKAEDWLTIIGVAQTAHFAGLDDVKDVPFIYLPIQKEGTLGNSFFVRSPRPAEELIPVIRAKILAVAPGLPVYQTGALDFFVERSLENRRGVLTLLGAFALVALVLSAVGIYGVLAYDVSKRTREIGIRGALGASRGRILRLILRQGLRQTALGLAAGLIGAYFLGRLMAGLLFQVAPSDPFTLGVISLLLLGVGLLSSLWPARRAARIDPGIALRCE